MKTIASLAPLLLLALTPAIAFADDALVASAPPAKTVGILASAGYDFVAF